MESQTGKISLYHIIIAVDSRQDPYTIDVFQLTPDERARLFPLTGARLCLMQNYAPTYCMVTFVATG